MLAVSEQLECRTLMSVGVSVQQDELVIFGSSIADSVKVTSIGGGAVRVDAPLVTRFIARAAFSSIHFIGFGGNDTFVNATSVPSFAEGGPGNDILVGGSAADRLDGGGDDDTLYGSGGDDHLYGSDGNDFLIGGAGDDHLYGENGKDVLRGGADRDYLDGGLDFSSDTLIGEGGSDTFKSHPGDILADRTRKDLLA
jgi:Ca2+-binding RTX toxin-like protein